MAEYIDCKAVLKKLHEIGGCGAAPDTWADGYDKGIDVAYGLVQRMPTVDVAPVRHGHWEKHIDYMWEWSGFYWCPLCKKLSNAKYDYCPNCGAQMDGGTGE